VTASTVPHGGRRRFPQDLGDFSQVLGADEEDQDRVAHPSSAVVLCAILLLLSGCRVYSAPPCAAPPKPAVETACQRELLEKNAQLQTLLTKFTELHSDVRALRRAIEKMGACETEPRANAAAAGEDCEPPGRTHSQPPPVVTPAKPPPVARTAADPVATITINTARTLQSLYGFGSTHDLKDVLAKNRMTDEQWRRAITHIVTDIGSVTGVAPPPVEYARPPPLVPGAGFSRPIDFTGVETLFRLFNRFSPGGIGDLYPTAYIDTSRHHRWLSALKSADYSLYLDEIAGKAVAAVSDWKKRSGREPEYLQLWNEPLSGNRELAGGTVQDLVAIIKQAGRRLREAGYSRVRFVVPNEETVRRSLDDMRAITQDEEARSYIGAIGYHSYPYGSNYSYIPRLLATRAQGKVSEAATRERLELRSLSRRFGIPVWMTEVSNGYSPGGPRGAKESYVPDSIDWIVGRAIHIHDEFRYAGASAFYGMLAVWTDAADRDHFSPSEGSRNLRTEGDSLVLVDIAADEVIITAMGRAIGHYGRWLRRGAPYLEGESSNSFVLVSPFLDRDRLVAVLVNTATTTSRVTIRLEGSAFSGALTGEQSRADTRWKAIPSFEARGSSLTLDLPGWSVTSVAVPLR
jgi:hypothetical protein